jgi:molybdopterin synthase catalytic subunit
VSGVRVVSVPDVIRLLAVRDSPLDLGEVYDAVQDHRAGGTALFVGTVRSQDGGRGVTQLEYSAHPTADAIMREVAADIAQRYDLVAVAATHRTGRLDNGEVAVVTAAAAAHRAEAFDACRAFIDELKSRLPIWKHQRFTDGSDEWVGSP